MAVNTQKALVVKTVGGPIQFADIPIPKLSNARDLRVKVMAVALNPVDWKIRDGLFRPEMKTGQQYDPPVVLGFDAAGIVESVGSEVRKFKVADHVYYSGDPYRPGSFQEYQIVDERIVGKKPTTLSFEEAAALPLTSLTAWEAMHEVMGIGQQGNESGKLVLITAGAGGVGSIASQLAKHWGLTVISSASRPETGEWAKKYGADRIVNHAVGFEAEFKNQGLPPVEYCFNTFSDHLLPALVPVVKPVVGHIVGINGEFTSREVPALCDMWTRRIQCNNELMFAKVINEQLRRTQHTRTAYRKLSVGLTHHVLLQVMYGIAVETQGAILDEVSSLVDSGRIRSHMHDCVSWKDFQKAFQLLEQRKTIGKFVLVIDENRQ